MKHNGDLYINSSNANQFAKLEEVTGSLYISADAQLPVLTSVGGSLYISADAQLPVLTSVGGYLDISADAQLPVLTSVGGSLYISADAQLPVLTSVGGSLYISADAQLPVLTSVGGSLYIRADAQLPVLTSVGGSLYISAENASFPMLKIAHGVEGSLVCVKKYGLWYSTEYKFYAGCQGPMAKRQAIDLSKKWDDKETAQFFAAAIMKIDDAEGDK